MGDDDLRTMMKEVSASLNASADLDTVYKVQEAVQKTEDKRARDREDARATLQALSRQLAAAKLAAVRPSDIMSAEEHQASMMNLDSTKFSLAKNINELEQRLASAEAALAKARQDFETVEREEVDESVDLDSVALSLKVIRELGFHPTYNENSSLIDSILVRSDRREVSMDVDVTKKESAFFTANQLWDLAS